MHVHQLLLRNFRNHSELDLQFAQGPVVLYGENGVGKTNILEALSYFSAGRGLRSAKLSSLTQNEFDSNKTGHGWSMGIVLTENDQMERIRLTSGWVQDKRQNKIQGNMVSGTAAFSEWLSVFWLTPEHDRLFTDSSKVRRKFLDRMIFSYDVQHAHRLLAYETAVKERLTLLSKTKDDRWLSIIEEKMATLAIDILYARQTMLDRLTQSAQLLCDLFPKFTCVHKGDVESIVMEKTKKEWYDWYLKKWKETRSKDEFVHMTSVGVHRADFSLIHPVKGYGEFCSTGEQKILLMGLVLAYLIDRLSWDDKLVLILLDECVSHFDFSHRMLLFKQVLLLHEKNSHRGSLQAFLTGTDRELFSVLEGKATFHHVLPNVI